ncbi:MAG: hypothetical protein K0V04_31620 [Deltaproteobacteria bacterium]|nr:hypothetical protein [Deltaproteobacteria bacterium]
MKKRGGLIAAVAAAVGVGVMAMAGKASAGGSGTGTGGGTSTGGGSGGGGTGSGGGSGGGGSGGGSGDNDDPWTPGPGGNGRIYGGGGGEGPPDDFDFAGNGLWISPDCTVVAEGEKFRPDGFDWVVAIEPPDWHAYTPGQEVLAVQKVDTDNSIAGFVDWAMGNAIPEPPAAFEDWVVSHFKAVNRPRPSTTAVRMVAEVVRQVSEACIYVPNFEEYWGEGMLAWSEDFFLWVDLYLHEFWSDDIDFDPVVREPEMDDGPPIPDVE